MIALISDVHANLEALEAVFEVLEDMKPDQIVCLGDVVGYGASPLECIKLVKEKASKWLRGNHEDGILFYAKDFNPRAQAALTWTKNQIQKAPRAQRREAWIAIDGTPKTDSIGDEILLVHGSPLDPVREYVLPRSIVEPGKLDSWFKAMGSHRLCFLGHSHVPVVLSNDGSFFQPNGESMQFQTQGKRCIVNVGSVGQPRDGDPRACFVTLDDDGMVTYHRVEYDVVKAMEKILAFPEIPIHLAERLEFGR